MNTHVATSSNKLGDDFYISPKDIVRELDRHVIGQDLAKRAVAISIVNRVRRRMVPGQMRDEIDPKNLLIIGRTGTGKTQMLKRVAKLISAPFIKVEATKFTEVGYVGRDVETIIRDLVSNAIELVRKQSLEAAKEMAQAAAEKMILEILIGDSASDATREAWTQDLRDKKLEDLEIEITVRDAPKYSMTSFDIPGTQNQVGVLNLWELFGKMAGSDKKTKTITAKIKDAREIFIEEESLKLIDEEMIIRKALDLTANTGIVFIDEIDKVAARTEVRGEVNREGVQRDLLPLIEGTCVTTKYGIVKTDHILFIASGSFHLAKPSDLLPELQGRLPVRVEMNPLTKSDFVRILSETEFSLIEQYKALLLTEGVHVDFTRDSLIRIAEIAEMINEEVEDIGARRLHTVMEKLMEDLSFECSDIADKNITIDRAYIDDKLTAIVTKFDETKFIL